MADYANPLQGAKARSSFWHRRLQPFKTAIYYTIYATALNLDEKQKHEIKIEIHLQGKHHVAGIYFPGGTWS